MCKNRLEENKARYKNVKNRTKEVVANSMRKEAEKELTKLNKKTNHIFILVKFLKKDGKDTKSGRCVRRKDRRLGFSEKDRKGTWKSHMKEIINKENDWGHLITASMVEGGPEMISSSEEIGIFVMAELCQRMLDGKGMPDERQTSVLVPILKRKGGVRNCNTYRGVKVLDHTNKIFERVLKRRIRELINIDSMLFSFMTGRETTDALFVVRRMQEEYRDKKKKLCMCFVDIEKVFDRAPR